MENKTKTEGLKLNFQHIFCTLFHCVYNNYCCFLDPRLVEFIRSRKTQSVSSSTCSSEPSEKTGDKDTPGSRTTVTLSRNSEEMDMDGVEREEEERKEVTSSIAGTIYYKELTFTFLQLTVL